MEKREISSFPQKAVALKTVWWIVKKTGITALPVWDPQSNPVQATGNGFRTWKRCVAIDSTRHTIPQGETRSFSCNQAPAAAARVVPLDALYHFTPTQSELDALRQIPTNIPNLNTATLGDSLALVAMHMTTKEIADWVWATFWWHDKPDEGLFAANRDNAVKVVWRNYLMSSSYSMDTPAEPNAGAHIAFNPWLEAVFPNGTVSNCMTCHRRAIFSGKPSDGSFLPVTRGTPPSNDPRFAGATTLDFLWSILFESK